MHFIKSLSFFLLALLLLANSSCDNAGAKKSAGKSHIVTAKIADSVSHLYYSGVIEPLSTQSVISHTNGVAQNIYASYGDWVQEKQKLMTIRSSKAQQDYAKELSEYVKSKDQYFRSKDSFAATTTLYQAGIVSKDTYLTEKSQLETNELSFSVAAAALKNKSLSGREDPGNTQSLENLTLENINDLQKILEKQYIEFDMYSPISGILLAPAKNSSSGAANESDKKITPGAEVKENQTLFTVGDMTGISTHIEVSEIQVNTIQNGQAVTITSWALPGVILQGKVSHVARQASTNNANQGAANFTVEIVVPTITDVQRGLIRVGMTAKIDIEVRHPAVIQLPLKAIMRQNGASYVTVLNAENQRQLLLVTTGDTDLTQVEITAGIKPGDKVLVQDD